MGDFGNCRIIMLLSIWDQIFPLSWRGYDKVGSHVNYK
jgi:hypothetical protein